MTDAEWAALGILVTLIIGIPAFFAAKSIKKNRQSQRVGKSGTGYQAGGNISINERKDG